MKLLKKIFTDLLENPLSALFLGIFLGALVSEIQGLQEFSRKQRIITLFSLIFLLLLYKVIKWRREEIARSKKNEITNYEIQVFAEPTSDAKLLAASLNDKKVIIGGAIEVCEHFNINSRLNIEELGWLPEDIKIFTPDQTFDCSKIYTYLNKALTVNEEPDWPKFVLTSIKRPTIDGIDIVLKFEKTTYKTIQNILPDIQNNDDVRIKFASLEPRDNYIPNSFCLHYITEFSDNNVLIYKRDSGLAYYPDHFTFSGEEQLAEVDFIMQSNAQEADHNLAILFKRALIEEIFPLGKKTNEKQEYAEILSS